MHGGGEEGAGLAELYAVTACSANQKIFSHKGVKVYALGYDAATEIAQTQIAARRLLSEKVFEDRFVYQAEMIVGDRLAFAW